VENEAFTGAYKERFLSLRKPGEKGTQEVNDYFPGFLDSL
jgi:hypothetical protein